MLMKTKVLVGLFFLFALNHSFAQVGINNTNPKASLDISASNVATPNNTDGILIPRVDSFPITNPTADQNGMLIYVTGNGFAAEGFYYWNNISSSWIPFGGAERIDDLIDGKSDNDGTNNGSSVFLGLQAGANDDSTGNQNVGVGYESLTSNTNGQHNVAIGSKTLYSNTTVYGNTALGLRSLYSINTGYHNTDIVNHDLYSNNIWNNNVYIGYQTGFSNTTGNGNIFIGNQAGYSETGSNKLYIENSIANSKGALIYGEFDNDILRINGQLQIGDPTVSGYTLPTSIGIEDQVLKVDNSGVLSWEDSPSKYSLMRANLSTNQILNTSGWQKLNFDTTVFDMNSEFNTTADRFEVNQDGYYRVEAHYHTSTAQTNTQHYGIAIYINGTLYHEYSVNHYYDGVNSSQVARKVSAIASLNNGDYIEIYVKNHQTGVIIDSFSGKTVFEVERIR